MDIVTRGLEKTFVYIDDVVVYSDTIDEHRRDLIALLQRFDEYGLVVNVAKCEIARPSICFLGLEVSEFGYRPAEAVKPKLEGYPIPKEKKDIQKFLGVLNYYRSHIPNFAETAKPLYALLPKGVKFLWTDEHQQSFDRLRELCQERITLSPLVEGKPFTLYTDASSVACGAVLLQEDNIIEFYSRKFSPTEQRYSTHERETLALVTAVLHFRNMLIGRKFTVYTDHKPLLHWLGRPPVNERHARWLVRLQDMQFDVKYIEGAMNVLADLMSRPAGVQRSALKEVTRATVNAISLKGFEDEIRKFQTPDFIEACKIPEEHLDC